MHVVCIAADPKGKGLPHWFNKIDSYYERSHIKDLRNCINQVVDNADVDSLAESSYQTSVEDVVNNLSQAIDKTSKPIGKEITKILERRVELEEGYEFVDRYRPDILELIGISIDEKYWADSYIDDYNYENYKWLGDFTGEMTASAVAETFSSILGSKIEKDAIEDLDQREALVYRVNEVLSAVDEDAYINIIKIEDVSLADFN